MNKNINGYLRTGNQRYPIGVKILLTDIYGEELHTGDTITLESTDIKKSRSVIFAKKGQIIGSFIGALNQENIQRWNVIRERSYKDLKNNEEINVFKVVLENLKQNHEENELNVNKELWNDFINGEAVISYDSFEDMKFLIDYLHEQGFREVFGFDGESLKRINLQNVWNLHNCIRVRDVKDKRVVFDETNDSFIQQCFEIVTFKELFNLIPPKQLSDYTNEELLEELNKRLK